MGKQINTSIKPGAVQQSEANIQLYQIRFYSSNLNVLRQFLILTFFLLLILISSCNGQVATQTTLQVDAYSSYNNTVLPHLIELTNQKSVYDSIILESQRNIGLSDNNIEIETTDEFGAYSIINILSLRRFFVYSPSFFDSVYSVTNTNYAIMSICFHELAHHYYNHPLQYNNASHIHEKQADYFSGYQMCLSHATLEQALAAINYFGTVQETETHPDRASRIEQIKKGYVEAKIRIFKDTTYLELHKQLKEREDLYVLYDEIKSTYKNKEMKYSTDTDASYSSRKALKRVKTKQLYSLYGELIYFTPEKQINLYTNNKTIGKIVPSINSANIKSLNIEGATFSLEDETIFSKNPDGSMLEVGKLISN